MALSKKLRIWYRFLRCHTRGLRRFCITLFSVVLVIARVLELLTKFGDYI